MNREEILFYASVLLIVLIIANFLIFWMTKGDLREMDENDSAREQRFQNKQGRETENSTRNKDWCFQTNHGSFKKFLRSKISQSSELLKRDSYLIPFKEDN
ncbi:MAG: hypothetical protein NC293_11690 [Roseburia sp.]|nr:hypothetical protein [Roseburia sp.]